MSWYPVISLQNKISRLRNFYIHFGYFGTHYVGMNKLRKNRSNKTDKEEYFKLFVDWNNEVQI